MRCNCESISTRINIIKLDLSIIPTQHNTAFFIYICICKYIYTYIFFAYLRDLKNIWKVIYDGWCLWSQMRYDTFKTNFIYPLHVKKKVTLKFLHSLSSTKRFPNFWSTFCNTHERFQIFTECILDLSKDL